MSAPVLPPRPATSLDVSPSEDEVTFFAENGYLVVERITTDEELDWLAEVYDHIFDPANSTEPGAPVVRDGPGEATLLSQAFMPEFRFPELVGTTYNRNARTYAAALLQVDADRLGSWGHMIRKLPGAREAPWHQDEAYWESELEYHALGCWLPMTEVTVEMGAMQFVPGSHRHGVFPHHPLDGNVEMHLLVADVAEPLPEPVACPLRGGATFHHQRTLHYTGPNLTDRPRLAFPTEFQVAPVAREEPARRSWVDEWRAATGWAAPTAYPADGVMVPL